MRPELRQYQTDVIEAYNQTVAQGVKRIMLVAATGSGKTVIAGRIIEEAVGAGQRVLFFSHRREITGQTCRKLWDVEIDHGIIQAGFGFRLHCPVQVASIQTLHRRAIKSSALNLPPAELVIVDEVHHAIAASYRAVIDWYPEAVVLGLTATPCRKDGRGLGAIFQTFIECPQVPELVASGFLVPTVTYAPVGKPDLRGIRTVAGDYNEGQLAERMNTNPLVGDIVTHWHRLAERRKTVVYAVDVAHSIHLRDEFAKSGVRAEHLDGTTPADERDAMLAKLAGGEIEVLCNCMVLTEGWDSPDVGCIVLARPTKSLGLYRQMVGRGLRPAAGKANLIVLDHSGAVYQHGHVDDRIEWTLDDNQRARNRAHEARGTVKAPGSRLGPCPKCDALRTAGQRCRKCGYLPAPKPRAVDIVDGELGRVDRNGVHAPAVATVQERHRWQAELTDYARRRGYQPGWVAHKFKEKFGAFPPWGNQVAPIATGPEVVSWIRSRMIAWAKRKSA